MAVGSEPAAEANTDVLTNDINWSVTHDKAWDCEEGEWLRDGG